MEEEGKGVEMERRLSVLFVFLILPRPRHLVHACPVSHAHTKSQSNMLCLRR